ncbi:MAG: tetratricopeptide repeat protein [Planctomycetia bacterium]
MPTRVELYKEGCKLKDAKSYEEALVKLREADAMGGADTLPMHAIVQCCTELNQHEEAIATAQKIVDKEPNEMFSYIALSRAYQRAGMIPEAEYAMMKGNSLPR